MYVNRAALESMKAVPRPFKNIVVDFAVHPTNPHGIVIYLYNDSKRFAETAMGNTILSEYIQELIKVGKRWGAKVDVQGYEVEPPDLPGML